MANLATLLQIVEAVLLALLVILLDLSAELQRVLLEDLLLFFFNAALLLFDLLLFVDDAEELVTLLLGLFGEAGLSLKELSLSGVLKVAKDLLLVLEVSSFLVTGLSLTLLEGALGSEGIDLSLTVGSLLLELSKAGNLTLLLLLNSSYISGFFFFTKCLLAVIFNDLLFEVLFLLLALVLDVDGTLVGIFDFAHHLKGADLLGSNDLMLFLLELLGLTDHLLHLALTHLLLLDALELSLLDLVNDYEGPLLLSGLALDLTLLLQLEGLESFDLHHEVESFLLFDPLALEALGLIELLVSDGHDLGVQHHLVHVLHIVVVLVEHLLGLGQEAVSLFLIDGLLLSGWHLVSTFLVKVKHSLLSCLSSSHG